MIKLKHVKIDWRSLQSIDKADRKKARLENDDYRLVHTSSGPDTACLTCAKEKT